MTKRGALLAQLPPIFRDSPDLAQLLDIFEQILFEDSAGTREHETSPEADALNIWQQPRRPLAEAIANLPSLLDPRATGDAFVPWLARWVALSEFDDFPLELQRSLIGRSVPLHAARGTRRHLEQLLQLCLVPGSRISIDDAQRGFELGASRLGCNSYLERDPPFFAVTIRAPDPGAPTRSAVERVERERARRIIDWAKPAHTGYWLDWQFSVGGEGGELAPVPDADLDAAWGASG